MRSCTRAECTDTSFRLTGDTGVEVLRDVYGKLLAHFCYRMLVQLLRAHCGRGIDKYGANAVAIRCNRMPSHLRSYYDERLAALPAA